MHEEGSGMTSFKTAKFMPSYSVQFLQHKERQSRAVRWEDYIE
jgi:hypothetical protein